MALFNPATWSIVDSLQGQHGTGAGGGGGGGGGGAWVEDGGSGSFAAPTASSSSGLPVEYGGGGGGGLTASDITSNNVTPQVDHTYDQWGGQAAYNALNSTFDTQKQGIYGSATDWANNYAPGYGLSIDKYLNQLRNGQQHIDERGVQNELGKKQATQGILGMVSRGIHSGQVLLSNRNASDSSAAGALANAYGEVGRGQLSNVGNKYALENRNIDLAQNQFNEQIPLGVRGLKTGEQQDVAGAVQQARDKLATLDQWAADKSLPTRIQVEQEKAAIQAQIDGILGGYNNTLDSGVAGIKPTSQEQRRGVANDYANAGTVATNPFDFSGSTPSQFQGSTDSISGLPLFTTPRKRTA
jgi:hypothetical protein